MRIVVEPCQSNCRPDSKSILLYKKLRLKFGHAKATLNSQNFTDPFNFFYVTDHQFPCFETQTFKRKYYLRRIDVLTDKGAILNDWSKESAIEFGESLVEDQMRTANSPYVILELYSSHHILEVTRSYDKIQDVLGQIGGLGSLLTAFMTVIVGTYNRCKLRLHVINKAVLKVQKK